MRPAPVGRDCRGLCRLAYSRVTPNPELLLSSDPLALSREASHTRLVNEIFAWLRGRVTYADALVEDVSRAEINRVFGGDEVVKPLSAKGALALRLVGDQGRSLDLSLGLLPFDHLRPTLEAAIKLLAVQQPNPRFGLAPVPNRAQKRYGAPIDRAPAEDVVLRFAQIVEEVRRLDRAAEEAASGLQVESEVWAFTQVEEKLVADTEGLFKTQVLPATFVQVVSRATDPETGRIAEHRTRIGDVQGLEMLFAGNGLRADFREQIGQSARRAVLLHGARALRPDELARLTHYVLGTSAMVFVHEAEGHNFEADTIKEGSSGLFHRDGSPTRVPFGSDQVDVWDGPIMNPDGTFASLAGLGFHFIDDEGVEVAPAHLVRAGEIVGKLHNRETAHHFGEAANGRGFSELGDRRLVRMTNTYLYPSERARWVESLEELVADIPFGVLLEGSRGGAVSKGGMSTTIQFGRLIVDGKLTEERLLPSNLAVDTQRSLEGVEGFAGPLRCDDPGFCGKGAPQHKLVTDGGPITRIRAGAGITLGF